MTRDGLGYQRVGPLVAAPAILSGLGVDPDDVFARCGLAAGSLANCNDAIPFAAVGKLLEVCVAMTNCPHFGLLIGEKATADDFGPVGTLFRNAPTLGDALRDIVANHPRYVDGGALYLFPLHDEILFGYSVYQSGVRGAPLIYDTILAGAHQIILTLSGAAPLEVLLSHDSPSDPSVYDRHYRAPLRFNAEVSGLVFSRAALERPLAGADPQLRIVMRERIESYWAAGSSDIVSKAQRALFPKILFGNVTADDLARALSMRTRTLNRRLEEQNTSFRAEVERLRYELARQLLANTRIPITQIGTAFGYAGASVFTRSFRRWSGTTPSSWRVKSHARRQFQASQSNMDQR